MSTDRWTAISAAGGQGEREAVQAQLAEIPFSYAENRRVLERAISLVEGCRSRADERSVLDVFLGEFGLRNEEGIALMCISEALLRIPDEDTAEALIAENNRHGELRRRGPRGAGGGTGAGLCRESARAGTRDQLGGGVPVSRG